MAQVQATQPIGAMGAASRRSWRLSSGWVGAILLLVIALPCFVTFPAALSRYDRQNIEDPAAQFAPPSLRHAMGTDDLGRSLLWRCLMGGAISLLIGMSAAGLALLIGVSWGMIAGYFGGVIDGLMMRIVDVIYGLPYLLMVVLLSMGIGGIVDGIDAWSLTHEQAAAEAGRSYRPLGLVTMLRDYGQVVNVLTLVLAIGLVSWLTMARVIRGQVLSLRSQPFIEATRALGLGTPRVLARHLLPNLLGPIVVYATLAVPQAILQESFLSFLGIGVRAPLPSWGNLAAEGVEELPALVSPELSMNWWLVVFPCLLLGLTLLGLNFAGDALRERFDPRGRR